MNLHSCHLVHNDDPHHVVSCQVVCLDLLPKAAQHYPARTRAGEVMSWAARRDSWPPAAQLPPDVSTNERGPVSSHGECRLLCSAQLLTDIIMGLPISELLLLYQGKIDDRLCFHGGAALQMGVIVSADSRSILKKMELTFCCCSSCLPTVSYSKSQARWRR
jgi:hypothetical protein